MNRKQFLRTGLRRLGAITVLPLLAGCGDPTRPAVAAAAPPATAGDCDLTPTETAGPFTTHHPESLVQTDITADREGVPLSITLTVRDANSLCAAVPGVVVDLWHCDAQGNYSEYGSTALQQQHFLRGRQTTNAAGQVAFRSVYPGWYRGRAPHLHLHIYDAAGKSLLVTQTAFPDRISGTVYAEHPAYANRGDDYPSNARDGVFRDGLDHQMAKLTGSVAEGFHLTHAIVVGIDV